LHADTNPQGFGFPTAGDPILIDMTAQLPRQRTRQLAEKGERFPEPGR
jgi:L-lactate dehydrogenase